MTRPFQFTVVHRGEPPALTPDPWATTVQGVDAPFAGAASRLVRLAQALAASPGWFGRTATVLVVRDRPNAVIAAVGRFDEADEAWLAGTARQLAVTLPHVTWLDYAGVERACNALANQLIARYGRSALRSYRFVGVPRGGLIVLGILAYLLDLPRDRLLAPSEADAKAGADDPLVVVDDIAISGVRLNEIVTTLPEKRLIIATLHAHPGLREAFLARYPQTVDFVAAVDLGDHAPDVLGDDYPNWLERWRRRSHGNAVWIGQPDRIAYPWNEPEVGVWNSVTQREEPGWSVIPPERVLHQRRRGAVAVQRMPASPGPLVPAAEVVSAEVDGRMVVGHLATGETFELNPTAATVWRSVVSLGGLDRAAADLAAAFELDGAAARRDVADLVAELVAAGLLQEAPT